MKLSGSWMERNAHKPTPANASQRQLPLWPNCVSINWSAARSLFPHPSPKTATSYEYMVHTCIAHPELPLLVAAAQRAHCMLWHAAASLPACLGACCSMLLLPAAMQEAPSSRCTLGQTLPLPLPLPSPTSCTPRSRPDDGQCRAANRRHWIKLLLTSSISTWL